MTIRIKDHLRHIKECYLKHSMPYLFVMCGLVGMLVDVDHLPKIIYLLSGGHSYPNGRSLHLQLLIIALCVCAYATAKLFGEYTRYETRKL